MSFIGPWEKDPTGSKNWEYTHVYNQELHNIASPLLLPLLLHAHDLSREYHRPE